MLGHKNMEEDKIATDFLLTLEPYLVSKSSASKAVEFAITRSEILHAHDDEFCDISIYVSRISTVNIEIIKKAIKAYFCPSLDKGEKITCWFNCFNKRVAIRAKCEKVLTKTRLLNTELENKIIYLLNKS